MYVGIKFILLTAIVETTGFSSTIGYGPRSIYGGKLRRCYHCCKVWLCISSARGTTEIHGVVINSINTFIENMPKLKETR